jgi:DNA-binding response OmpR family regulator
MDYDVILLDRFPPDKGGVALSRDLCKLGIATPILMLTARIGWGPVLVPPA